MKKPAPYEPRQEPDSQDVIGEIRFLVSQAEQFEERFRALALATGEGGDQVGADAYRSSADAWAFSVKCRAACLRKLIAMEPYLTEVAKLIVDLRRRDREKADEEAA